MPFHDHGHTVVGVREDGINAVKVGGEDDIAGEVVIGEGFGVLADEESQGLDRPVSAPVEAGGEFFL